MGSIRIKRLLGYSLLSLGAISMVFPFFWMIVTSLMTNDQAVKYPIEIIPHPVYWGNYPVIFRKLSIVQLFLNSLIVATVTTAGYVIISAMAAYSFARIDFRGRNIIFFMTIATMMIPPQVNIVPLFFLMREFHFVDTYYALILPGLFGGLGIFFLRQWFLTFPREIEESARIDGCSPWKIFWEIVLPLSKPALATISIFTFITTWNSFIWPLVVINSDKMATLPIGIALFKASFRELTDWPQLMAASVITIIPVVIIFLAGQKYFIQGIITGSVKE